MSKQKFNSFLNKGTTGRQKELRSLEPKGSLLNLLLTIPHGYILAFRLAKKRANWGSFPTSKSKHSLSPAGKYSVAPTLTPAYTLEAEENLRLF